MSIQFEKFIEEYTAVISERIINEPDVYHWHSNEELIYIIKGFLDLKMSGEIIRLKKGDIAVVERGEIHQFVRGSFTAYVFTFRSDGATGFIKGAVPVERHITDASIRAMDPDGIIAGILDEIFDETEGEYALWENMVRADMIRLYSLLCSNFPMKEEGKRQYNPGMPVFRKLIEYMAENFNENITLSTLAAYVNYTPTYISSLFKKCAGVNFKVYLTALRLNMATMLLKNTDEKIITIATRCGYDNVRSFNKAFLRITGMSPREYRRSKS